MKRFLFILVGITVTLAFLSQSLHGGQGEAMVIELEGTINPGTAQFVKKHLERAQSEDYGVAII
jgi:membrane-bound ClpP family serine protease